jgi:integrase
MSSWEPMATTERYITKGGTLWRVRYRKPDGSQTSKRGFATKKQAEAFGNTVETAKQRNEYVAPSDGRVTVGELGPGWLRRRRAHMAPSGFRTYESAWRIHVQPRWGDIALGKIMTTDVADWIADLFDIPVSPSTANRAHYVLSGILADAVTDRLLSRNPAAGVTRPANRYKDLVFLTHEQLAALAEASGEHAGLVLTLGYTGIRWAEAVGLRVSDLGSLLGRRRITVTRNAVQSGSEICVGDTKTHKRREVPIMASLVTELARQCEGRDRDDLLFPGDDGGYLRRPHPETGWFAKAVAAAGIPWITPHDLRHTAASLAVSAGANVKVVQRMLGHASATMTLDIYAALFDDDLEAVATKLDEARSQSRRLL